MSIDPVGGAGPVHVHVPVTNTPKADSGDVPGVADKDRDKDGTTGKAPAVPSSPGPSEHVNVKA